MKTWIRRVALALVALIGVGALAGARYETVARRHAIDSFAAPGRLVAIGGGRRIHLDCRGAGAPTIVLEAGLDAYGTLSWAGVHDSLAATTRTCAYSRAGILWSDPAPGAFASERAADDLHAALTRAGERGPYVMVGHSLGGPYVLTFTARYPNEVAGLALVDASHPDQRARFAAAGVEPLPTRALMWGVPRVGPAIARVGMLRLVPDLGALEGWTPVMRAEYHAIAPGSYAGMLREWRQLDASLASGGQGTGLGDRPLVVLTGMREEPGRSPDWLAVWKGLQDEETRWSTRGRHVLVSGAAHYIQVERPDVVIAEVRHVVADVRGSSSPASPAP